MLNNFITTLLYSLIKKLSGEDVKLPGPFEKYLESREKNEMLKDFKLALEYVKGEHGGKLEENPLFSAIAEFFADAFALRMEVMNEVAGESGKTREAMAEKLIRSDTVLAKSLKHLLASYTYQELAAEIQTIAQKTVGAPYTVIQAPREIDLELKKEIRETLQKENPSSMPIFQVNRKLIGGMRIFRAGAVQDRSWINRVHQLIGSVRKQSGS